MTRRNVRSIQLLGDTTPAKPKKKRGKFYKVIRRNGMIIVRRRKGRRIYETKITSVVIPYSEVMDCLEVEPDDSFSGMPWDDDDYWKHETCSLGYWRDKHYPGDPGKCHGYTTQRHDDAVVIELFDDEDDDYQYLWYHGASKQVAREMAARRRQKKLDQLKIWHSEGIQYYMVSGKLHNARVCLGGIDDEDYAEKECIHDAAYDLISELEADGYIITGKPDREGNYRLARLESARRRWHYNLYSQSWDAPLFKET